MVDLDAFGLITEEISTIWENKGAIFRFTRCLQ